MYREEQGIIERGEKYIGQTALEAKRDGMKDKTDDKSQEGMGASVAALTPFKLGDWIGEIIRN